ncbi:MAG: FAD:protein FMN transferase [Verrucomicrobiota bacterium]
METVMTARAAMATRFEILLHGENATALRAAGEAALDEVERLEGQLSLYRPTSEIRRVNRHAAREPVRVSPPIFRLLLQVQQLWRETGGAFDPTVLPLVRAWGFMGGAAGRRPDAQALAEAQTCVGMNRVELDPRNFTVRFAREGMALDLGAIGKGYAVDCAAEILVEAGVTSAFMHGGTSSCFALGRPPDTPRWKAAIPDPRPERTATASGRDLLLAEIPLGNESLGVSAIWGRFFTAAGRTYGHVLDPRLGEPVQRAWLAAVVLTSAAESDALSTALLTLGVDGLELLARFRPGVRALVMAPAEVAGEFRLIKRGL